MLLLLAGFNWRFIRLGGFWGEGGRRPVSVWFIFSLKLLWFTSGSHWLG